ncbi:MAG: major facilitator superfamily protein [Proteobacteria bacterium]|nr:major facilitator superfamily protein [Pseudomonadota bacterium]
MTEGSGAAPARFGRMLLALILGQIGLHATMAGVRMAAPLQALRDGHSAWSVGVLMALYAAAPVLLSMHAGRMADRLGYHRPVYIAIGLSLFGALLAVACTFVGPAARFALLCASAVFVGSGANMGLIVIQRRAGQAVSTSTERMRMFSWLGIAPSLSNVVGPVAAGFMIDAGGFRAAYGLMLALPLVTWWCARQIPRDAEDPQRTRQAQPQSSWTLLAAPGLKRLLVVNWVLSACWDVHMFAVPILGFERGFNATTIGLIVGTFTLAVSGVRLLIPLWAHRISEIALLRAAMVGTAIVFGLYPLAHSPWLMGGCAVLLGLTLGSVQPMIMTTLHQLTPAGRYGEAIAMRSMVMNASSTAMPLLFGAAGTALGAAALFWLVGGAVASGSWVARRLPAGEAAGP